MVSSGMRIYLAGPEVFLPDALAVGAAKKALCAQHGHVGVFPLDPPAPSPSGPPDWRRIHAANEMLIRGCDALVANLTPFRGTGADAGTVFELGFMRALGRPVHGYSNVAAGLRERTPCHADGPVWRDAEGLEVEDFGLGENLMIEGAIAACGGTMLRQDAAGDRWRDLAPFAALLARLG
jgi:nucleoside 2-deoxyribosyltransferase